MKKKPITTFLLTLLLTLGFSITVFAEEAQPAATATMYATENVNVRSEDSTSGTKLGTLTKGQAVASNGRTEKGWYVIDFNGQTGYVSGKYLTDNTTPVPVSTPATTPSATSSETKTFSNGVTFVNCGYTPNGLKIWCASWDTSGTWSDNMIAAYDAVGLTNDMSDYDKAVAINNYICRVVEYDNDFYNGVVRYRPASEVGRNCLTSGRGMCGDYAEAFDCLCTMAGVYSNVVYGTGTNAAGTGAHVWNYVLIGDTKYWVDPCWNDSSNNAYLMSTTPFSDHTYQSEKQ